MLFNLDKQTKKNILEHYKQEALNNHLRKQEERKKEIEEERNALQQKQLRQKVTLDFMNKEIQNNRNKLKEEYNLMLQKTKGYFPRKADIIINNWGQPKEPFILPKIKTPLINNYNVHSFLNDKNNFRELSPIQKEKEILKQIDHMGEYLTDKQNLNEVKRYFLKERENRHNFYKDLLYSQYTDALNKNLNLYGTKDQLILKQRKKKFISDNPYIKKRKYESGSSSLEHNPILNPENNYDYNKYINCKNFASKFLNINNNNNQLNNIKNFDNNLYSVQKNKSEKENINNKLDKDNNIAFNHSNNNNLNGISNKYSKTINSDQIGNENNYINNNINNSNSSYDNNNKININNLNLVNRTQRNQIIDDINLRRNFSQGDIYY